MTVRSIYLGDDKLKEVCPIPIPIAAYFEGGRFGDGFKTACKEYKEAKDACKVYPIVGNHSFEVGKEYEEGKDYFLTWTTRTEEPFDTFLVACSMPAIPLPKDDTEQNEIWEEVINRCSAIDWFSRSESTEEELGAFKELKSKFNISRK